MISLFHNQHNFLCSFLKRCSLIPTRLDLSPLKVSVCSCTDCSCFGYNSMLFGGADSSQLRAGEKKMAGVGQGQARPWRKSNGGRWATQIHVHDAKSWRNWRRPSSTSSRRSGSRLSRLTFGIDSIWNGGGSAGGPGGPPRRVYPIHIPETSTATSRANTPTTAASNAPPFDWAGRIPFPFHLFSIWIRVASSRESVRISYNVDNLFRIRSLTACTNTLMVELDLFLKNDSLCHSIGFFQYRAPYISMVNGNSTVTPPPPDYSDILVFCNTLTLWLVRIRSKIRSVFKKIWFKFWFPQLGN